MQLNQFQPHFKRHAPINAFLPTFLINFFKTFPDTTFCICDKSIVQVLSFCGITPPSRPEPLSGFPKRPVEIVQSPNFGRADENYRNLRGALTCTITDYRVIILITPFYDINNIFCGLRYRNDRRFA